jgi:phage host-nuclease inhibitor protein Gam
MNMEENFKIENDKSADWAIKQIHEAENERDRLIALANDQIADLKDHIEELVTKCDHDTAYLKSLLAEYFETVKSKETKTQKTYKLLSGTLVFKKPSIKINHNDDKLIEALDGTEFVEIKKSLKWGEYKKNLIIDIDDNNVIDTTTGEVIEGCSVEDVPASFTIKY